MLLLVCHGADLIDSADYVEFYFVLLLKVIAYSLEHLLECMRPFLEQHFIVELVDSDNKDCR